MIALGARELRRAAETCAVVWEAIGAVLLLAGVLGLAGWLGLECAKAMSGGR